MPHHLEARRSGVSAGAKAGLGGHEPGRPTAAPVPAGFEAAPPALRSAHGRVPAPSARPALPGGFRPRTPEDTGQERSCPPEPPPSLTASPRQWRTGARVPHALAARAPSHFP